MSDNISTSTINGLSPEQREDFQTLVGLAKHDALGIVYTELDGKPVAVVMTTADETELMIPLAILVNEDLVKRLANPFDLWESDRAKVENDGKPFDEADDEVRFGLVRKPITDMNGR